MVQKIVLEGGNTGFVVRYDIDGDGRSDKVLFDEEELARDYEDCYVRAESGSCGLFQDAYNYKRTAGRYFILVKSELKERDANGLVDIVIDRGSSYSAREKAFSMIEDLESSAIDSSLLERMAKKAPQKYRDWALNELEWRKEKKVQEEARNAYVVPAIESIISSRSRYSNWDIWKKDPLNQGMFFTGQDLVRIARKANNDDNRREAVRRLEEKNKCESESGNLSKSASANRTLSEAPYPYYWNMVLRTGLQPYKDRVAEKMFQLIGGLPDSDKLRGVYERILQGCSPRLRDRAAKALIALGLDDLSITNLRYLVFYARGSDRDSAIKELRGREVTDPEQRKHIIEDLARCSRTDPETACAEAPNSYGSDLMGRR